MPQISAFDVVGPIMVGPSPHIQRAVRLGLARVDSVNLVPMRISACTVFAATHWGHRTDVAILAGLLGMSMDDSRIPQAKELADAAGLQYAFQTVDLGDVHPNSVRMRVLGKENSIEVVGASVGGGRICIYEIDRFEVEIDGSYTVLLARYKDQPGVWLISPGFWPLWHQYCIHEGQPQDTWLRCSLVGETDDPIVDMCLNRTAPRAAWKGRSYVSRGNMEITSAPALELCERVNSQIVAGTKRFSPSPPRTQFGNAWLDPRMREAVAGG